MVGDIFWVGGSKWRYFLVRLGSIDIFQGQRGKWRYILGWT